MVMIVAITSLDQFQAQLKWGISDYAFTCTGVGGVPNVEVAGSIRVVNHAVHAQMYDANPYISDAGRALTRHS